MKRLKITFIVAAGIMLIPLFMSSCAPARGLDRKVDSVVAPYRFSIAGWEIKSLVDDIKKNGTAKDTKANAESVNTTDYFSSVERIRGLKWELSAISDGFRQGDPVKLGEELNQLIELRASLTPDIETTIESQIAEVLVELGIRNPLDKFIKVNGVFPPVNFKLQMPPYLLVISPREKIKNMKNVLLRQDITLSDMESIEKQVEPEGVSALVLELGGLATAYPTFVTNNADIRFTIDAATEEWLHQYLFFKPLGFRYFLDTAGIRPDYEIATINETVAGIVSKEIGSMVYNKYYRKPGEDTVRPPKPPPAFDFNLEMRNTRKTVDAYLARGEVTQAEQFMETERVFLASKGYHIRKLNQAYFAFYGTYGDHPMSISPIGTEVRALRTKATSLKDFLDTASKMTSREDLRKAVGKGQ